MTESKYNKLITTIFWFALPFIIAFFTWIVINIFAVQTGLESIKSQGIERNNIQEKMWTMLQENNRMLNLKADEKSNEEDHLKLMMKLNEVSDKLLILSKKKNVFNYTENPYQSDSTTYYYTQEKKNDWGFEDSKKTIIKN